MARYNEILVGRFARAVQKLFGMKGTVPVGSLAGELTIAHALQSGAENRYLEGWDVYGAAFNQPAVAGNLSGFRLRNPQGSGVIVVITKIAFSVGAAEQVNVTTGLTNGDFTTVGNGAPWDTRGRSNSSAIPSQGSSAASTDLPGKQGAVQLATANQTFDFLLTDVDEHVLLPGSALNVQGLTVNLSLFGAIQWRERLLEDSERT